MLQKILLTLSCSRIISAMIAGFMCLVMSCSPSRQISKTAGSDLLHTPALQHAHAGISIFDPEKGKYLYQYQGDKYFVPASNTKLATCYAAMKYLGDSLVGGRYIQEPNEVFFQPAGDPGFLLPEFKNQPLLDFFRKNPNVSFNIDNWKEERWGSGWSWNDYDQDYMAERSVMPLYGNIMNILPVKDSISNFLQTYLKKGFTTQPAWFIRNSSFIKSDAEELTRYSGSHFVSGDSIFFRFERDMGHNVFYAHPSLSKPQKWTLTFSTSSFQEMVKILEDTLHIEFSRGTSDHDFMAFDRSRAREIRTRPTDSILRPMMHRSDNFFAEQSLLMVSDRLLGYMKDADIIDTLLKTDYRDLPQRPVWVDGCGLSRYNLFTPQDMVMILDKLRRNFGMDRLRNILATGNEGTLRNYYVSDSGFIYAKTGTLSGVVALSGFLYTRKGKLLEFSVLVNNHSGSAGDVRRAVEKFLKAIRMKF